VELVSDDLRARLRAHLVAQLKEDAFVLFFQPIIPAVAGSLPSFREILVRYEDEEKVLLPPGTFFPILEEEGLLFILDRWVIGRLLRWGSDLQAGGKRMPRCSVNLCLQTIQRDAGFAEYVLGGMQRLGISPSSVAFEITTADAIAHPEALARMIAPMRAAGVQFALSWFAGEERALELGQSLGISFIKIDGSRAAGIARDLDSRRRFAAIIERCRKMQLRTVCMFVEDAQTLDTLRSINIDYVQGFAVEKPRALES
jgi:EAL domain-containing protein (putative c-di-GMP-specific phosphodiesterase class I)